MPFVPKTYDRNLQAGKYYSTARVGKEGYNPETTTIYYGSDDNVVHVTEVWRGTQYDQTVSGSCYTEYWPSFTCSVTYFAWEETTVS
jgi:hypothetical protein